MGGSEVMQTACREYTQPRNLKTSRPRGWIRSNTKIGPALNVKIYPHEGRYCVDIMIESLVKDQTVSGGRIMNGINKYVAETSEENSIESVQLDISTGRLVAKAKQRPKNCCLPNMFLSINPKPFNQGCFAVSKIMITLLRHDRWSSKI